MIGYTKYGPYLCIAIVLFVLFLLWFFWGGGDYEFVGLAPLDPNTCSSYTGSVYNWGNITPAIVDNDIPSEMVCEQETINEENLEENNVEEENISINQETENVCHNNHDIPQSLTGLPIILDYKPEKNNEIKNLPQIRNFNLPKKRGRFISRGERMCCQTMEKIYGVPFKTVRPEWLVNPETGEKLELDCYNEELKIAVEYNGEQHYNWPNFTNQTHTQFINQVRRDELKMELCDRNGIYLIVVPYTVSLDKIPEFITSYLPETLQNRLREEDILSNINGR